MPENQTALVWLEHAQQHLMNKPRLREDWDSIEDALDLLTACEIMIAQELHAS